MFKKISCLFGLSALLTLLHPLAALAAPQPWQYDFQESASPVMEKLHAFHNELLVIITGVVIFVLALLIYVCVRFRKAAHPVPSKVTHHTLLEIIWTAVPVLILIVIAIPSFRILYFMDRAQNPEMTLKATGYQWYWGYEYPEHNIAFESYMVPDDKLQAGQPRLLETDTHVVLPVDTTIRVLITANDVLHAWAMPSFGIKTDAVPGRINETWVKITKEGTYYGQCSELCGNGHGYMPITVNAVSKEEFAQWVKSKSKSAAAVQNVVQGVVQ